jgi:hypothetical protein
MPENFPYVALRPIKQPGTLLTAYRDGDGLPANAVDEWDLIVGEDVMPVRDDVIGRPDDDADRARWEAFAIGQGWSPEDAREASMADLRAVPERDPELPARRLDEPQPAPDRPAESAVKAEWVEWAVANGTTKAELQEFQPDGEQSAEAATAERTDTVAEAADEQTNG